jgi:large subunit ribosomal protein L18
MKKELVKREQRLRRKKRVRAKIFGTAGRPRLSVNRSNRQIYLQAIDDSQGRTLISASTMEIKATGAKSDKSWALGELLAKKAKERGVKSLVFDRGYYKYHGRIKKAVESLRKAGIEI